MDRTVRLKNAAPHDPDLRFIWARDKMTKCSAALFSPVVWFVIFQSCVFSTRTKWVKPILYQTSYNTRKPQYFISAIRDGDDDHRIPDVCCCCCCWWL